MIRMKLRSRAFKFMFKNLKLTFRFHPELFHLRFNISLSHFLTSPRWLSLVGCHTQKVFIQRSIIVTRDTSSATWVATIEQRRLRFLPIYTVMYRIKLICRLIMRWIRNVFRWWIWNGNFDFFMLSRTKAWKAFGWGTAKARCGAMHATIITMRCFAKIWTTTTMNSQC